jgi:conjugal transfer pilus assembly protein TraW
MRFKESEFLIFLSTFMPLSLPVGAKILGTQGTTFEIKEQSLLEVIQDKLRVLEGPSQLADYQKKIQERMIRSIEHPKAISGIVAATFYRSRDYNPSLMVDEDIKDHKGRVVVRKGTIVNPLDDRSFGKPLLLIQGEDDAQVSWALKQDAKIVLVNGKPLHLTRTHKKIFYFDQGGILSKKFGISAVPAKISQKGKALLIEEFNPMKGVAP